MRQLRQWAESWARGNQGAPFGKGAILIGEPGIGKTSSALALANEFGWGVIELNASDARNYEVIMRVVGEGAAADTFTDSGEFVRSAEGRRKLIILDEADNLYARIRREGGAGGVEGKDMSDAGGKRAIVEVLKLTRQPIVLTVNDYYKLTKDAGAALRKLCYSITFKKLSAAAIRSVLQSICSREGIKVRGEALKMLAERASGELRSAINDLQALCEGVDELTEDAVRTIGQRDPRSTVFKTVERILKGTSCKVARSALWEADEDPETMILWLEENLPLEYRTPTDLRNGFEALARADVFLGRVRRRQYYGLWGYAADLMSSGVALAKSRVHRGWSKYTFPSWLRKMSASKASRATMNSLLQKLAQYCHTSTKTVSEDMLPYLRHLVSRVDELAIQLTAALELTAEELTLLLGEAASSTRVKEILKESQRVRLQAGEGEEKPVPPLLRKYGSMEEGDVGEAWEDYERGKENYGGERRGLEGEGKESRAQKKLFYFEEDERA